jgi:N-acetyl-anhydromuramyl-L-alanine amidase AmpD
MPLSSQKSATILIILAASLCSVFLFKKKDASQRGIEKFLVKKSLPNYDTIVISFPDLKNHYPDGRGVPISGIILHSPTISCIFETISVLEEREVGCHYIVPQQTLRECKDMAQKCLLQQDHLPKSKQLSPLGLKAAKTIMAFKGNLDAVPVLQLADDSMATKHAGIGAWKNWPVDKVDQKINRPTIGIECGNSPNYIHHDLFRHSEKQMLTLVYLLKNLLKKHKLSGADIVTHSDVAWNRPDNSYKIDPGPAFPFETLARHGLGFAPLAKNFPPPPHDRSNESAVIAWVQTCFRILGYAPCPSTGIMDVNTRKILRAYALHFFPLCKKYQDKNYDWSPVINSLLYHPWAPFFLTTENCWDDQNSAISQRSEDLF